MDIFKQASREGIIINTTKGPLSVQQLWTLSTSELDALAVSLESEHKESGKKSFLNKVSLKDKTAKLKFDIVHDILLTLDAEERALAKSKEDKEYNKKIIEKIAALDDKALDNKTRKQLESLLR